MAKYESIVKIRGTIDGLTFRDTPDGPVVGRKTGPTSEKVLTHENFKRTRSNASEFKQAVHDARLLRRALGGMLDGVRCTTLNGHVNGLVHRICKTDQLNDYGSRCAAGGDVGILTGFDLNKKLSLDTVLTVQPAHRLDGATGMMKVHIAPFIAYKRKGYSKEATHFRMVSGGVALNFSNNSYSNNIKSSELLPLSLKTPEDIWLEHQVNGKPGDVFIQVLGIQLYKLVNGKEVLVKGGAIRILEARKLVTRIEDELHELKCNEVEKGKEAIRSRHFVGSNKVEGVEEKVNEVLRQRCTDEEKRQPAYAKASADDEGHTKLMGTQAWENFTITDAGYEQGIFKNYGREDRWRTHFLSCCPFHNHNPESTITGKQTIWVNRAAKCSDLNASLLASPLFVPNFYILLHPLISFIQESNHEKDS